MCFFATLVCRVKNTFEHRLLQKITPDRIYHRVRTAREYEPLSLNVLERRYGVQRLTGGKLLEAGKQLHAEVYLHRGFVTLKDIENDTIHRKADPYQDHADYFGVIDRSSKEVVAIARQITQHMPGTHLPIFRHLELSKQYDHVDPAQLIEISAFAKKKGVDRRVILLLLRAMLRYSKTKTHKYWLIACDKYVYGRFKALFGPVIKQIGAPKFYMGSEVIPAEIDLDTAPRALRTSYHFSLPPLRKLRRFLYDSFIQEKAPKKRAPSSLFWNAYAKSYDGLLHFYPYRHLVDHVSDKVAKLQPVLVLDLGCGTGNLTKAIHEKCPDACIDAVDWSEGMLKQVASKVPRKYARTYQRDLLLYLKGCRKQYDVIVLNNVLYTITERDRLWVLLYRRLAPGGHIVIANPDTANSSALLANHLRHASARNMFRAKLLRVWAYDTVISFFGSTPNYDFTNKQELLKQLDQHDFTVAGKVERCYGGHKKGIDLLLTARKK